MARRSDADRRARQSQRLGRALRLLCLIQDRHGRWDLASLARELGCSTKTVQRDLLALEDAHVPFFYDARKSCYAIRPGFRLSILDARPGSPADPGANPPPSGADGPASSVELAESSRDHAERILREAERLIEVLGRLCRSLRNDGLPADGRGPKGGESA